MFILRRCLHPHRNGAGCTRCVSYLWFSNACIVSFGVRRQLCAVPLECAGIPKATRCIYPRAAATLIESPYFRHKKTGHQGRFFHASPVKTILTLDQQLSGAGRGNRTLVGSLGSYCSTIKLYPLRAADFVPDVHRDLKFFFGKCAGCVRRINRWTEPVQEQVCVRSLTFSCTGSHFRLQMHAVSGLGGTAIGWLAALISRSRRPRPGCPGTLPCAPYPGSARWPGWC